MEKNKGYFGNKNALKVGKKKSFLHVRVHAETLKSFKKKAISEGKTLTRWVVEKCKKK